MTKVLHIGQLIGGLSVYIRNSIQYANANLEFIVAHGETDKCNPLPSGVKEYRISLQRSLNPITDLKCLRQSIRIVRREKPDVIHCHSAKGGVIGRIVGWVTHTPTLYTPHAFSFLCSPNKTKRRLYLLFERMARLNSILLACSGSEREIGINEVGYKPEKALAWNNSVPDISDVTATVEPIAAPYIIYVGRPCYQKNMPLLIDVADRIHKTNNDIKLLLLGVGYYSPDLEQMKATLKEKGIEDCFILKSWITQEETFAYMRDALFYLSTSHYEGLPLSVVEAMCLGKAVVATDVTGNSDCVTDGTNGFLVKANADDIAAKCLRLIDDAAQRKRMGEASRELYEENFDIKKRIPLLADIYNRTVKLAKVNRGGVNPKIELGFLSDECLATPYNNMERRAA